VGSAVTAPVRPSRAVISSAADRRTVSSLDPAHPGRAASCRRGSPVIPERPPRVVGRLGGGAGVLAHRGPPCSRWLVPLPACQARARVSVTQQTVALSATRHHPLPPWPPPRRCHEQDRRSRAGHDHRAIGRSRPSRPVTELLVGRPLPGTGIPCRQAALVPLRHT
jgi:hypothetical protein